MDFQTLAATILQMESGGIRPFAKAFFRNTENIFSVCAASGSDNNIVFSWEYELTQAMLQMVQAGLFQEFPELKIIVHHAGAMAPFFAGRIDRILPPQQSADFRKFYADTAILGNPRALALTVDFFGADHVVFGTDAPLGILPAGATKEICEAIEAMNVSDEDKQAIFEDNYRRLIG